MIVTGNQVVLGGCLSCQRKHNLGYRMACAWRWAGKKRGEGVALVLVVPAVKVRKRGASCWKA